MLQIPTTPPSSPRHADRKRRGASLARRAGVVVASGALVAGAFAIAAPAGASTATSARTGAVSLDTDVQLVRYDAFQQDKLARKQKPPKTTTSEPTTTATPAPTTTTTPAPTTTTTPPTTNAEWTVAGSMVTARIRHASAALPDGQVLVAGGMTTTAVIADSELYDPATGTWRSAADLPTAVYDAAAVTLPDGTVMVAGGSANSAQFYYPDRDAWTRGPSLPATGNGPAFAAALPDGTIFVLDGSAANGYDPTTGTWKALATSPPMRTSDHFSMRDTAQLPNGDIVTLRAMQYTGSMPGTPTTGPAVYHWASNTWTLLPIAPQNPGDRDVSLAALPNGNVMLAGGVVSYPWFPSTVTTVMEVDPTTGAWSIDANSVGSNTVRGQLVTLPNGSVLSTGGNSSADLDFVYSPTARAWAQVTGRNAERSVFAALANGSAMATGGYSNYTYPGTNATILGQAAIFTP